MSVGIADGTKPRKPSPENTVMAPPLTCLPYVLVLVRLVTAQAVGCAGYEAERCPSLRYTGKASVVLRSVWNLTCDWRE